MIGAVVRNGKQHSVAFKYQDILNYPLHNRTSQMTRIRNINTMDASNLTPIWLSVRTQRKIPQTSLF